MFADESVLGVSLAGGWLLMMVTRESVYKKNSYYE